MTKQEFESLYGNNVAVHCDTEEKANEFLALADSVGYKWFTGVGLVGRNYWKDFGKETCYKVGKYGLTFDCVAYFKENNYEYEIIEYTLQPKFKLGDKVRVNNTLYIINGKVGVIVELNWFSPIPYGVKFDDDVWLWFLPENDLEKVEEPTYKEETIDDIIEEIECHQKAINVLHNRLKRKAVDEFKKNI